MRLKTLQGFTLLELMIVVAIIGIISAIAYPSYRDSVLRARRAEAKAVLLEAAQFMDRFYTENFCYSNQRSAAGVPCGGGAVALPAPLQRAPKDGTKYYDVSLTNVTQTTYVLRAQPSSEGAQNKDPCATLTLDQASAKGVTGSKPVNECWGR